jgi:beta-D-galactosyl-(1->4)-L-rhamnose phosphorylase
MHEKGEVYTLPLHVAVLHSWGSLRSWSLSGHFHETYMHELIHINEALSGLPVKVSFISFEDVKTGALQDVDVVINAGRAGSAWSGGDAWKDAELIETLQRWVDNGGAFIGVGEPSAVNGYSDYFRMAQVLGVDEDTGAKVCHGKWQYETDEELAGKLIPNGACISAKAGIYLTDGTADVIQDVDGIPAMTVHSFGKGKGIYLGGFAFNNADTRLLLNTLLYAAGLPLEQNYLTDHVDAECAYYPESGKLVVINNSGENVTTTVKTETGAQKFELAPFETKIVDR